jgi:NAD-dependent dihydropyrimidine dehydrogenase PreA subunit
LSFNATLAGLRQFLLQPLGQLFLPPQLHHRVAADELGVITGTAMLKDETRCIRCGLCAERCPVNVITMEAYSIRGADLQVCSGPPGPALQLTK